MGPRESQDLRSPSPIMAPAVRQSEYRSPGKAEKYQAQNIEDATLGCQLKQS